MYLLFHDIKCISNWELLFKKSLKAPVFGGNKSQLKALKREKALTYLRGSARPVRNKRDVRRDRHCTEAHSRPAASETLVF